MANWSDPQQGAAPFGAAARAQEGVFDAGLRSYMLSVYNYMASAVLLTGIVAMLFAKSGAVAALFNPAGGLNGLGYIVMFAPVLIPIVMSMGAGRMQSGTLQLLYWGYAVLMGLSLSTVFLVYTGSSIAQAFFSTAAAFAGLSLYGYTTKRDLSAMGTFFIMGLVGLIVASVINVFLHSGTMALLISLVGVLLFAGLTAYDTQRTKSLYFQVAGHQELVARVTILSALSLYLDFINMFLFILRLFGNQRN